MSLSSEASDVLLVGVETVVVVDVEASLLSVRSFFLFLFVAGEAAAGLKSHNLFLGDDNDDSVADDDESVVVVDEEEYKFSFSSSISSFSSCIVRR